MMMHYRNLILGAAQLATQRVPQGTSGNGGIASTDQVPITAVTFFTEVVISKRTKLDILATHLITASKRLLSVPDFRYYTLAGGIREVCARSPRRAVRPPAAIPQLEFGLP